MMKILVVDDERMQRDVLKGFLEKQGYEVSVAPNGEQALQRFAQLPFHPIPRWARDSNEERLNLPNMILFAYNVEAKMTPLAFVPIPEMMPNAPFQITGQSDIVEPIVLVQGVNTLVGTNEACYLLPIVIEDTGTDFLKVPSYNCPCFSPHGFCHVVCLLRLGESTSTHILPASMRGCKGF